jgi:signal-transduction protein with cAMP-binding, CBS, and nucleotidyltransferase domain
VLSYLEQNIGNIADKDFAHIGEDSTVTEDAKQMRDKDTTSIFIAKKNSSEPLDAITERDNLYHVLTQKKDPSTTSLRKVMNYPLIFVDEDTTIKEAICLMRNRYIQRLPIKKAGRIIGIVTLKRIIGTYQAKGWILQKSNCQKVRRETKLFIHTAIRNLMKGIIHQSISMIIIYSIASSYARRNPRSDRLHYCCFLFYLEPNSNF